MSANKSERIRGSEITDEKSYLTRRSIMRAGILAGSALATGWIYRKFNSAGSGETVATREIKIAPSTAPADASASTMPTGFRTDEPLTSLSDITHYNNFYEFELSKDGVADASKNFVARPWKISVGGLVGKPSEFDLDDLLKIAPIEERVYRMRCVEAWSMVVPWAGFSLSKLLERVEPLSSAKFVAFQTLLDPKRMPNQNGHALDWPYVEGLRMDEAMHPLTLLTSGLYGHELPPQDGAPIRLIVPWKYGFKGIKSIVKINLVAEKPKTTWNEYAPNEYGFYANVNPAVDHPRWSQATERRIGGSGRQATLPFNGYGEQVAHLYSGMDLRANF